MPAFGLAVALAGRARAPKPSIGARRHEGDEALELLEVAVSTGYASPFGEKLALTMRYFGMWVSLFVVACATEVTPDGPGPAAEGGSPARGGATSNMSGAGAGAKAGSGTSAFGGTASNGGSAPSGGSASTGGSENEAGANDGGSDASGGSESTAGSGGAGGSSAGGTAGVGGKGGSGGTSAAGSSSGGTAGAGGSSAGGSGGAAGSGGAVGTGDCAGVAAFKMGTYKLDDKVTSVCNGGTPCTQPKPPLTAGKTYEFKCLDGNNCGREDPGTTNWVAPAWAVSRACN